MNIQEWIDKLSAMGRSTLAELTPKEAKELADLLKVMQVEIALLQSHDVVYSAKEDAEVRAAP